MRVLGVVGCLLGAFSVLEFGVFEGFGCCWMFRFLRVLLGSVLWSGCVIFLYTPCVCRGALRFFNKSPANSKLETSGLPTFLSKKVS
jgi:hypothetical protein